MEIKEKQLIFETKTKPFKALFSRGLSFKFIAVFTVVLFFYFFTFIALAAPANACEIPLTASDTGSGVCNLRAAETEEEFQAGDRSIQRARYPKVDLEYSWTTRSNRRTVTVNLKINDVAGDDISHIVTWAHPNGGVFKDLENKFTFSKGFYTDLGATGLIPSLTAIDSRASGETGNPNDLIPLTHVSGLQLGSSVTPPPPTGDGCVFKLGSNVNANEGTQTCSLRESDPKVDLNFRWIKSLGAGGPNSTPVTITYTITLLINNTTPSNASAYTVRWFNASGTEYAQYANQFSFTLPPDSNLERLTNEGVYFAPRLNSKAADGTETPIELTKAGAGIEQPLPEKPKSGGIAGFISDVFLIILGLLSSLLYEIFSLVVKPILKTVLAIPVHTFKFAEVIIRPWAVIRNLMNIFFMLSLIAVSLATLFRLGEKWNYRDVLVKIVTMALLINFSLSIAQVILGIAQTFQNQFLPADSQALEALAYSLLVEPFNIARDAAGPGGLSELVGAFVKFFFSLSAFMVFVAITAFALVRIVALWLLLMTSPIAYAAYVLPITSHYAKSWWKEFIRYAFLTPLLGLMLQICGVIAQSQAIYVARLKPEGIGDTLIYGVLSSAITIACLTFGLNAVTKGVALSGKIAEKTTGRANKWGIQAGKGAWNLGVKRPAVNSKNAIKRGIQNKSARTLASSNAGGFKKFVAGSAIAATGGAGAYFKTKRDLRDARNKEAQQKAEASARHYALLHATGIEDKEHIKAFSKADDENMARYKDMGKKDLLAAYQTLKSDTSERGRAQMRALLKSALDSGKLKNIVEAEKGSVTEANINEVLSASLKGDPEKDIFLNAFDDAAKKKGDVAYTGHNKGSGPEAVSARNTARVEWIKDLDDKEIANISTKGLNMKDHASVMAEAVKKIASQERIPTSQAVKATFSTGAFDRKSGKLIFETIGHAHEFEALQEASPAEALRLYNRIVGVEREGAPGWIDRIPPGFIVEQAETNDQNIPILDTEGKPTGKKEYLEYNVETMADGRTHNGMTAYKGDDVVKAFKVGVRSAGQTSEAVDKARKRDKRGRNDDDDEIDNAPAATPPASPPSPKDPSHQNTTEPI